MIDLDRLELGGRNFIGARLTPPLLDAFVDTSQ